MEQKPKALAACQAVLDLLNEGADINTMTVSQVAERAGVGKGTLYDYFTSKEEMVVSAILFEVERIAEELERLVEKEPGFQQKIYGIFDCMERNRGENNGICRFIKLTNRTFSMGKALQQEMEKKKEEMGCIYRVLEHLCADAETEGLIDCTLPREIQVMTMASKFLMFLLYLENARDLEHFHPDAMKGFLYKGLLADLNVLPGL